MFILYFAMWVVLNGRWTTEIGIFGLVFAAAAYAFTWKYMGFGPKLDLALVRRAPSAISYGITLLVEIIKANLVVVRMILNGEKEPEPQTLADGEPHLQLTEQEMQLVLAYRKLDSDRRREILEQTETLRPTED